MSIFRETFPEFVQSELRKRQNLIRGESPFGSLRNELVNYQTTRNAWVRMTSGVDTYNSKRQDYDNELAKKYVLLGGTLYKTGELKNQDGKVEGDFFTKKSGIGSSFDKNAYSNISALGQPYQRGIRPMPGITNISTSSKNAYGSLIEAVVSFTCWDIQQLEDLELLYMRPGYTVLLEWGWTHTKQPYFTYFYDILNKGLTNFQQVNKDLFDLSRDSKGNYEAVLGYVKNYNWKARPDGGYDCTTTLISLGEVLESIKVNYSPYNIDVFTQPEAGLLKKGTYRLVSGVNTLYTLNRNNKKEGETDPFTLQNQYSKGILYGLLYEMRVLINQMPSIDERNNFTIDSSNFVLDEYANRYPTLLITGLDGKTYPYSVFKKNWGEGKNIPQEKPSDNDVKFKDRHYITLEALCTLINNYVLIQGKTPDENNPEAKSIIKLSVQDREYAGYATDRYGLKCLAHPLQISTDFTKCLINASFWADKTSSTAASIEDAKEVPPDRTVRIDPNLKLFYERRGKSESTPGTFLRILDKISNSNIKDIPTLEAALINLRNQIENSIASINPGGGGGVIYNITSDGTRTGANWGNVTDQEIIKRGDVYGFDILKYTGYNEKELYNEIITLMDGEKRTYEKNKKIYDERKTTPNYNPSFINFLVNSSKDEISKAKVINVLKNRLEFKPLTTKHAVYELSLYLRTKSQEAVAAGIEALKGLKLLRDYFDENSKGRLGNISSIYIDISYLMDVVSNPNIESIDTQSKSTINLINFFKEILRTVQNCTGNVNNFDIHIDKDGVGRIIDVNFTDDNNLSLNKDKIFQIELHNLKSIVRNYQLESKIFPEQGTIIAVSAQVANPGRLGYNNSTLIEYNRGIRDRLIPKKEPLSDSLTSASNIASIFEKNFTQIKKYFDFINDPESRNNEYAPGSYNNALRDLIGLISTISNQNPNQFKAIIPVMLSFDMDGIGGIVIGNVFRINENVLPSGYKSKDLGFLVKSFNHKIENNDWITTIEAYPIILKSEEDTVTYWKDFIQKKIELGLGPSNISVSDDSISKFDQTNIDIAMNFFLGKGYTVEAAAALVGGFVQESAGLKPDLTNSIGAYGIAQWLDYTNPKTKKTDPRKSNLLKKANYDTLQVQLDYVIEELNSTEARVNQLLKAAGNDITKAVIAAATYERFNGYDSGALSGAEWGNRYNYTIELVEKYKLRK